ncbi:MAG: response regulator transcription factor [Bacteroidota bacterium]|nr:response regulator transcription factor [Bacteroidota bacterium]
MNEQNKILIIDDEIQILRLLEITLGSAGYSLIKATTGKEGLAMAAMYNPSVILLDLGLPDEDGFTVLKKLREWFSSPVIILSVRNEEENIIRALDSGANDYITKPFRTGELHARIRSAFRQSVKHEESPVFTSGPLRVDMNLRIVKVNEAEVKLTATEYSLLALMVKNAGRVLTHSFICREIWGTPYSDNTKVLRVHMAQLRKKIEPEIPAFQLLITEPGVGYRLKVYDE